MVDIPDVIGELLLPAQGIAAVDLGPAGDARLHLHASRLEGVVERQVTHQQGPRADDAHVAAQHVDELGELVDGVAANAYQNLCGDN